MTVAGRSVALLALFGPMVGCSRGAPARSARSSVEADARAIEAAMGHYIAASNRGDVAALASLYAKDAILLPPEHTPIEGRDAIVEFWRQGTDEGLTMVPLRVDIDGDLGYVVGRYTLPATAAEPADSGKCLMTLRRQRDGAWQVTADIWNSSVPAESTPEDGDPARPPQRWRIS